MAGHAVTGARQIGTTRALLRNIKRRGGLVRLIIGVVVNELAANEDRSYGEDEDQERQRAAFHVQPHGVTLPHDKGSFAVSAAAGRAVSDTACVASQLLTALMSASDRRAVI